MAKIISPVKRFSGHVTLPEYLTVPQVQSITAVLGDPNDTPDEGKKVWVADSDVKTLPAILACVSEWHLEGIPDGVNLNTFPMSPKKSVHELITWLFGEIYKLWSDETDIPNG